jgi:cytochrome c-type biogenesis protein CcmF
MLVFNNLLLTAACGTVFVGTLYPLALEAVSGAKISVGPPYFNMTFGPIFLPLLFAVPFGPLMAWKRGDLLGAAQRLVSAFALAGVAVAVTFVIAGGKSVLAPFVIGLAFFAMAGALVDVAERTSLFRGSARASLARARGLPRSAWGTALAHFGLGVSLLGIVCETQWGAEQIASVKPSQTLSLRSYDLTFEGLHERRGPNYTELIGRFTVRKDGETAVLEPAKRAFEHREMSTTEAALLTRGFSQLYISLGDSNPDGSTAVRLYHKPLVLLIWLGAVVMVLGGALSLSDRRLRVGAPKPARVKTPVLQPAE